MEKQELLKVLREQGMDGVEDICRTTIEELFELVEAIVIASKSPIAASIFGVISGFKGLIMSLVDKIDGKEG